MKESLQPVISTEETNDLLLDERLKFSRLLNGLNKKLTEIQDKKTNSADRIWRGSFAEDEQKIINQISETEERIKQIDHDFERLNVSKN